jgi:hypothetical protein
MSKCLYPDTDCMDLLDDDILYEIRKELDDTPQYIKDIISDIECDLSPQ